LNGLNEWQYWQFAASATPVSEADIIELDFCLTMAPDNQMDSEPESDCGSESDTQRG